ncbi:MAG: hypothetical protein IPL62_09095 [Caulobacteraceae bacterium]|nr:hypothetical protein [Caulobacteraceae bacterium]
MRFVALSHAKCDLGAHDAPQLRVTHFPAGPFQFPCMKFGLFAQTSKESRETKGFGGAAGEFRSPAAKKVPARINVCREYQKFPAETGSLTTASTTILRYAQRREGCPPKLLGEGGLVEAACVASDGLRHAQHEEMRALRTAYPKRARLTHRNIFDDGALCVCFHLRAPI